MEYKINTLLPIQFEKIDNPPYLNDSRHQAVRIYIAHEFENYNGSYFDISVLEKMGSKMAGVPIVGYISADNANNIDFNGHEERLVVKNGEFSIEYLGKAYGCILSNDDVSIVERMHDDGKMRKYLCANGVLWKMFTDSIDIFDRDTFKNHSMELEKDSISGTFEKDGYYHFEDAKIRALCILGDGHNPGMGNSIIEKFSAPNIQDLLFEINESIKQYNQSSAQEVDDINFSKKEDDVMSEALELLKKYNLTQEDISFNIENMTLEDIESKIKEHFELLASDKRDEIINALSKEKYIEEDEYETEEYPRYYYIDHNSTEIFACDYMENWCLYGFTYSMDGDSVVIDFESKKRKKFQIVDFEEGMSAEFEMFPNVKTEYEIKKLKKKFASEKKDFETKLNEMTSEYEKLKSETMSKERQEAEEVMFVQFDEKLKGVEEYEQLKENASNFELDALEKECYAILGKKNAQFSTKTNKKEKVKIDFAKYQEKVTDEYAELFEKYLRK